MSGIKQLQNIAALSTEQFTELLIQEAINMGKVSDVKPGTILAPAEPVNMADQFSLQAPEPVQTAESQTQDLSGLVSKTFFLRVRYGLMGNTRKVAGIEVLKDAVAMSNDLRVSKTLMDSTELEAIRKHDSMLRKWLGNMCLPFLDWPGVLVLPKSLVKTTQAKLKLHQQERNALVDVLIDAYPALKEKAQAKLAPMGLYKEEEYPHVSELKELFVFDWEYKSFGTPDSLKEIDPELYTQQQDAAQEKLMAASDEITAVMREKMLEMVSHLQERLLPGPDGKAKILRESAVDNLKAFLDTFDLRNVTDDKELELVVTKARALLSGTNAQALRNSETFREQVAAGMDHITKNLGEMVIQKPGRKFRVE